MLNQKVKMSAIFVYCLILLCNKSTQSQHNEDDKLFYASIDDMLDLVKTTIKIEEKVNRLVNQYENKLAQLTKGINLLQDVCANQMGNILNPIYLVKSVLSINKVLGTKSQYVKQIANLKDDMARLTLDQTKTTELDIEAPILTLFKLQDFYNFQAENASLGVLKKSSVNLSLSVSDCYEIGSWALERQDAHHAKLWLNEAKRRLISEYADQTVLLGKILLKLASVYSVYKDEEAAGRCVEEVLQVDPLNEAARQFQVVLQGSSSLYNMFADRYVTTPGTHNWGGSFDDKRVQQLCQQKQPFDEQALSIFCYYEEVYTYYHVKVELVSMEPLVGIIHEIMTNEEIETFHQQAELQNTVRLARNHSTVINFKSNESLQRFKKKIAKLVQPSGIAFSVLYTHFDVGEFHKLRQGPIKGHEDFPVDGQKGFLMMMFLNDVPGGGDVIFPSLNISVSPRKRNALFWDFQLKKSYEETIHSVCPVFIGNCTVVYVRGYSQGYYD